MVSNTYNTALRTAAHEYMQENNEMVMDEQVKWVE